MDEAKVKGPLSNEEVEQMKDLLRRYCANDLDQWEGLQTATPFGPVYVFMTQALPPEWEPTMFREF
ncbi:hypothetical protein ACIQZN_24975 [Streptomyces sp. NPDC097595]|uniref:hypothetical protein n=1 Tax=Streptomyces sp. NPDC097595 TaxID=3366090 RepID=UPI00382EB44C